MASAVEYAPLPIEASTYDRARAKYFAEVFQRLEPDLEGISFQRRELQDTAAHGLNALAEDENADLIVLGSTHRGVAGRVFPGTVADRLLSGAPCAVAVAPRDLAASDHVNLGRIGIAYDGRTESKVALGDATRLAQELGAELRVISVVPAYIASDDWLGPVGRVRDHFRAQLETGVAEIPAGVKVDAVLEEGEEPSALARQGADVDLLVMGSRGYGPLRRVLLGGVSSAVMRAAPCPVMVVPRGVTVDQHTRS